MGKLILRSLGSMLASSKRMAGRSWMSELLCRTLRSLFLAGNQRGLAWFRDATGKPIAHPDLKKVSKRTQSIAGIDCLMVQAKQGGDAKRIILYIHGGGYVVGSPMGHLSLIAPLSIESDCLVIAPDYRLSPDAAYPAAQDDCLTVARAVRKTYPEHKLILAGDSAGGALALATQLSMQADESSADGLILISPWVDPNANSGSILSNANNDYLAKPFLDESVEALMQGQDWTEPRMNFTQADLSQLPPTLVQYASGEIFADQVAELCARGKAQGSPIQEQAFAAQFHVFQLFSGLLKDAKKAIREMAAFAEAL